MSRITYPKIETQENPHSLTENSQLENPASSTASIDREQEIIRFKRLIVASKKKYEKHIQELNQQSQDEQEERKALKDQIISLKAQLKTAEESLQHLKGSAEPIIQETSSHPIEEELASYKKRNEQLDRALLHLRERMEEAKLEAEQLREELQVAHSDIETLQKDLVKERENHENAIDQLINNKQEVESISQKKRLEHVLVDKETMIKDLQSSLDAAELKIAQLQNAMHDKNLLHDRYEMICQENKQLTLRLEEALDARIAVETSFNDYQLIQEKREKTLLEEGESQLKTAQQHFAKKVKEAAILSDKVEEQDLQLQELMQALETSKARTVELQKMLDSRLTLEKKLQDQLQDNFKNAEAQAVKWEAKYFAMYEKWQESEIACRELKKYEERYLHLQGIFSNFGGLMGVSLPVPQMQSPNTIVQQTISKENGSLLPSPSETKEMTAPTQQTFDLFGMRHSDKFKQTLFDQ